MALGAFGQDENDDLEGEFNRNKTKPKGSKESFWKDVRFGGQFWASFGNPTYIELSPMAFKPINQKLITGLGFSYMYQSFNQGGVKREFNVFGPRALAQYYFLPTLFAHAELEALNLPFYDPMRNEEVREWVASPLIGLGFIQRFGSGIGGLYASLLYNPVFNPDRSPYPNAFVFRMGMIF